MGIAAYNRGTKAQRDDISKELNLAPKILAETLILAEIRREARDKWRQDAMSYMVDSSFFKRLVVHMSSRRGYQTKRNAILTAHAIWIDAQGEIELNHASHKYAQAVHDYIAWIVKGYSVADDLLSEFR